MSTQIKVTTYTTQFTTRRKSIATFRGMARRCEVGSLHARSVFGHPPRTVRVVDMLRMPLGSGRWLITVRHEHCGDNWPFSVRESRRYLRTYRRDFGKLVDVETRLSD